MIHRFKSPQISYAESHQYPLYVTEANWVRGLLPTYSGFAPLLTAFWSAVFQWFSGSFFCNIAPNQNLAIFRCSSESHQLALYVQMAVHLGMEVANKLILLTWKSATQPSFEHWLNEMSVLQLKNLQLNTVGTRDKFGRMWWPLLAECNINLRL